MLVEVYEVNIPAWSTVGYGMGIELGSGDWVRFAGDHRPMHDLGEAIAFAGDTDELPQVELEDWQVLSREAAS